jgi:hypothetical protein
MNKGEQALKEHCEKIKEPQNVVTGEAVAAALSLIRTVTAIPEGMTSGDSNITITHEVGNNLKEICLGLIQVAKISLTGDPQTGEKTPGVVLRELHEQKKRLEGLEDMILSVSEGIPTQPLQEIEDDTIVGPIGPVTSLAPPPISKKKARKLGRNITKSADRGKSQFKKTVMIGDYVIDETPIRMSKDKEIMAWDAMNDGTLRKTLESLKKQGLNIKSYSALKTAGLLTLYQECRVRAQEMNHEEWLKNVLALV